MRTFACTLLLLAFAMPVFSHPSDQWLAQGLALARWAEAVSDHDIEATAVLTAEGVTPFAGIPNTTVSTRYATFTSAADGVTASPVIFKTDGNTVVSAWTISLVEEAAAWKIKAASPAGELPAALVASDLPEHSATKPVTFSLTDGGSGRPVHARVRVTDAAGDYWPPDGHQKNIRIGWRQDVGGDVQIAGETFAYVQPSFVVRLPPGDFTIEVRKGTEYLPATKSFTVTGGSESVPEVNVAVDRWINMNADGWYSGDTHTHFLNESSALLELRAEDLNVIYVLATKWDQLITDVTSFIGAPSPVSTATELVVVNEETRHGWLGHTILHGIEELVHPLTWGGPTEGVRGGFDYPAMAHQADKTHAQGGLVTWAHFPFPGGELPIDVALGKIDTVDLFTWGDAFGAGPTLANGITLPGAVDTWYLFLNTNARLPATAGTDKMLNVRVAGSVRTFAKMEGDFTYEAWLAALKAGRTMVSTGPVVTLTANGQPVGSELMLAPGKRVKLRAEMRAPYDLYPVDQLEIVVGGEVVQTISNDDGRSELTAKATIRPEASTWVAARVHGDSLLPYQAWALLGATGIPPMAHTSPIYVVVDDKPVWGHKRCRAVWPRE